MTTGGLSYACPKCNNPLFITFRVADLNAGLKRTLNCPGCKTQYLLDIRMETREG